MKVRTGKLLRADQCVWVGGSSEASLGVPQNSGQASYIVPVVSCSCSSLPCSPRWRQQPDPGQAGKGHSVVTCCFYCFCFVFLGFGPFGEHTVNASWIAVQVIWIQRIGISLGAGLPQAIFGTKERKDSTTRTSPVKLPVTYFSLICASSQIAAAVAYVC